MNINVVTEDLESLVSRRMVLDLIENDQEFFKNKKHTASRRGNNCAFFRAED